ncbi:antibiotic biosynthesis monooxygenase [Nocardioides houyundeii]|uniref:antibiotic biosynthesis monooxygenase n=1 Tax=Nocardioides houyundeii TaxID=2045452 RepID=UPI000C786F38|nr:antibiotic biosynthesis monooxygenase [Nocardioides houyundeii]
MTTPVTVSVTRHVDPAHTEEMLAWVEAGSTLAQRFDGFLGSGWVKPQTGSPEWHMLYRFASAEHLSVWEESPQRAWWLAAGQGRIEETRVERRTGIEGWFDEPVHFETLDSAVAPVAPAPPRWKQMVIIFMVFFPLSLCTNWLAGHLIPDWPLVPRVLLIITVMTPLMTYVLMPFATRKMQWFLQPGVRPRA